MPPSPPVGGEGWGEAAAAPVTTPGAGTWRISLILMHAKYDFSLRRPAATRLTPINIEDIITILYSQHITISPPPENQSDLDLMPVGSGLGHYP